MPRFTILHLSDLQAGNDASRFWVTHTGGGYTYSGNFHTVLADALADASKALPADVREPFRVDLIAVTGDNAEHGDATQYEPVATFLKNLELALTNRYHSVPQFLIIPGNHDINWNRSKNVSFYEREKHFGEKFADFNRFLHNMGVQQISVDRPFVVAKLGTQDEEIDKRAKIVLVGFNSCIRESHRYEDHYGWIGDDQLNQAVEEIKNDRMHHVLLIAAFHHNPLVYSRATGNTIFRLANTIVSGEKLLDDKKLLDSDLKEWIRHLKETAGGIKNHLAGSDELLSKLSQSGFSLALHGHQHFDDVATLNYSHTLENAYHRSSITVIGAGSAGLVTGSSAQPSIPSVQLLVLDDIPWGWRCHVQRVEIVSQGAMAHASPISWRLSSPYEIVLPKGKPLEVIRSIANSFFAEGPGKYFLGDELDQSDFRDTPDKQFPQFVLWTAKKLGVQVQKLPMTEREPIRIAEDEIDDLAKVYLRGIHKWTSGTGFYGDRLLLSMVGLRIRDGIPYVALKIAPFSRTVLANWSLPFLLLSSGQQPTSFRAKHVLHRLGALGERFFEWFPYLSHRCEVTVIATVGPAASRSLLVTRRPKSSAVAEYDAALFVGGGCRPPRDCRVEDGEVVDPASVLLSAALTEMVNETNYIGARDNNFHLLALYLDPHYLTPVWLYWLQLTQAECERYEQRIAAGDIARDHQEHLGIKRIKLGRDDDWSALYEAVIRGAGAKRMTADASLGLWIWHEWVREHGAELGGA